LAAGSAAVGRVQDLARHLRAAVQLSESRRQVRGERVGGGMRNMTRAFAVVAIAVVATAVWLAARRAGSQEPDSPAALAARAATLEREITALEDVNAIKKLQRSYGFYTDKQLWSEAASLFAADGTIEVGSRGVYVGPERIRQFLLTNGPETPQPKRL